MVEIFNASPKSMGKRRGGRNSGVCTFEELEALDVGKCFLVSYALIKGGSVRNKASIAGKKLGRVFTVVDHGEAIGYEVARIK